MTEHDRVRRNRAMACDRTDRESLHDAIRGLQSTDDPSLGPLYDELMDALRKLEGDQGEENTERAGIKEYEGG